MRRMFRMPDQPDVVTASDLSEIYRRYIDCLNRRALAELESFVDAEVVHNDRRIGLDGYRDMLAGNYRDIPDLHFTIDRLACEPPHVAARLWFDCHPSGFFLGVPVNGSRVSFAENVFYAFEGRKIARVWSVIDKAAVEDQIRGG